MDMYEDNYLIRPDFHALNTIQLFELIRDGFINWEEDSWSWKEYAFNEDTYKRLTTMFNEKYFWREIGITPLLQWKQQLLYKIKFEMCPKYNKLYKNCSDLMPIANSGEFEKQRSIDSEYPETLLSENQDYISKGNDFEKSRFEILDPNSNNNNVYAFKDIDQLFIDELDSFFLSLYTYNVNAW